jgi:hypothetical protein
MKKCKKCQRQISIMEEYCSECLKNLSLREKLVEALRKEHFFSSVKPIAILKTQANSTSLSPNISLKTTPSAPSKLPTATSLNNNIKLKGGQER